MSGPLGFERSDGRNLLIVASVITVVVTAVTAGPIAFRLSVGVGAAVISSIAFLVSTLLINRYKPDHW
ncbi:hypothetical protein [Halorubrum tibetense]|uniref:Major facilitator superfamily (MFS) profile domain-containing protein n=1 Tax=Halorubrum tibetense TaxID=175631 RepID=A0ABD5S9K9_9EURY